MHASDVFRWVVAIVFGLFGWWLIVVNFAIVYFWFVRRRHASWIPLVGGFFACVGMALCPLSQIQRFAFWPLFIDAGYCILALAIGFFMEIYARRKKPDA